MTPIRKALACTVLATAMLGSAASPKAAQPEIITPPTATRLPNVLYELPYAVWGRAPQLAVELVTVVSIGNPRPNGTTCRVQVEWIDWDGTSIGLSGPASLALDDTLEFTSSPKLTFPTPYILNVARNSDKPFEGHAKIRSTCADPKRLRIDAQVIELRDGSIAEVDPVKVVRPIGNEGD